MPVDASVVVASSSLVLRSTGYWPSSLSDPDRLAQGGGNSQPVSIIKGRVGIADAVGVLDFPVGVGIDSKEVNGIDDGAVTYAMLGV